jgi:hypothetical protein
MERERTRYVKKQAEIMRHRRMLWVLAHGPCELCGSWDELEVDHRDKETKESHRIWSYSDEERAKELAKCRVLCYECHVDRHRQERIVHGTRERYRKGCRCEACILGAKQARREERVRREEREAAAV